MSNELPKQQSPQEIDLGQVFGYIERFFKKIGELITEFFKFLLLAIKKIGILLLFSIATIKKQFLKIALAGVLGYGLFFILAKTQETVYESNMIVKQNYESGKVLYNTIYRYSVLAAQKDSMALSKEFKISPSLASNLESFEIKDNLNKNYLLEEYNKYFKAADSSLVISYEEFVNQYDLENVDVQTITVYSLDPNVFPELSGVILESLLNNKYFIDLKDNEISSIEKRIESNKKMLVKSDTLQSQYVDLLKDYYAVSEQDESSQQTNLNFSLANSKDKVNTKEYELFEEQKSLNMAIIDLEKQLNEKKEILNLQSDFSEPVKVRSFYHKYKIRAGLLLSVLTFLIFLLKQFGTLGLINEYGSKEKLLEK